MLSDNLVNFMVEKIRNGFNFDGLGLEEKSQKKNKVIIAFKRGALEITVKFSALDLAEVIYGFLDPIKVESVTYGEFKEHFMDYVESALSESETPDSINRMVYKILDQIYRSKLPGFGGRRRA